MGTTNVPAISWGTAGPVAPSGPAILAGVQADISASFATPLNFNLNTPQGQLASSEGAIINNTYQVIVYYATQVDPAYSKGRMQDAIARIYSLTRIAAQPTILQILCLGAQGTVLPAGPTSYATIQDDNGNIYQCTQAGTIPAGGSIVLSFAAVIPGPIAIPESVSIYQNIPGWDTATIVSGTVGNSTETSQQFELRRQASVQGNSTNQNDSILGAVLGVPGVTDAYVIDNPNNEEQTIGGVVIPANTLYVAVTGGSAAAVAFAIWTKKPPGIPLYSGNNSQDVQDPNPAYSPPAPSYTITWETPAPLQIYFAVAIVNSPQIPSNATALIQQAIVTAFQGGVALFNASISGTVLTVTAVEQGALSVGMLIAGPGVQANTIISALGTGTGGIGTYSVSISQTVAATAMTAEPVTNTPIPARARIGSTIYASQYGALIGALGSWAAVKSLQVGSNNSLSAVFVGYISGNTLTVTAVTSGTIAVGQFLSGSDSLASIVPGTYISALGTGSGGTGTYTLSNSITLAGATFTGTAGSGVQANQLTASSVTGVIGIGDVISGTGIPSGTTILSQLSGTPGGAGVYITSGNTTASSAAVTCAAAIESCAADNNYVETNINQEPTIGLANVVVSFD